MSGKERVCARFDKPLIEFIDMMVQHTTNMTRSDVLRFAVQHLQFHTMAGTFMDLKQAGATKEMVQLMVGMQELTEKIKEVDLNEQDGKGKTESDKTSDNINVG